MSPLIIQVFLLVVFSLALAIVVSAYRDDDRGAILRGIPRRALLFGGAMVVISASAYLMGVTFLFPSL